jgi:hypothetical protein
MAMILMFAMVASMIAIPTVLAPSTAVLPSFLIVSASPNPVGVGQYLYINAFLSKPTATVSMGGIGDRYQNITVVVTDPDGVKTTFGPSQGDPTGGVWYTFVPSKLGNYTIQGHYPGQVLTYGTTYNGLRYLPADSETITFTVQQAPIQGWPTVPLPTMFWTRPIYATNYAWGAAFGSWYGLRAATFSSTGDYDQFGNFDPFQTDTPDSSHIIWTKPVQLGGQPGEPIPSDQVHPYYATSILANYFQPIIVSGILYTELYTGTTSAVNWTAIDLKTGETLWTMPRGRTGTETLRMGQTWSWKSVQEYGSASAIWSTGGGNFYIYDALTGLYMANITGVTNGSFFMDDGTLDPASSEPGTLYEYYTNSNSSGTFLTLWNSTKCIGGTYSIKPSGTINFTRGIQWQVKVVNQTSAGVAVSLSMSGVTRDRILFRSSPTVAAQASAGFQVTAGYDATTGGLLWGPLNQTITQYEDVAYVTAGEHVYILRNKDTLDVWGYSLDNGQLLWGPVTLPGNAWSHIEMDGLIAYGKLFMWDYGGYVNALDIKTGKIVWTWVPRSAGYNTPYGTYPIWHFGTGSICDGKLWLSEGKMYDPPLSPGCKRLVINCTDGTEVWSILSFSSRMSGAIGDGVLISWNCYDKQIDAFGKGPTQTTVSAAPKTEVIGNNIIIEGKVIDISPGTKQTAQALDFPNGVAAVNDASQSAWMEYVYMQQPYPTNCTGVEVTLDAYDPNGNFVHLGTATSDTSGTFSYMWPTPAVPGEYRIIATFPGSKSYYASYAETAAGVSEAPIVTPPPTYPIPMDYTMSIIGAAIAVIIAVAIVGLILLRKKP